MLTPLNLIILHIKILLLCLFRSHILFNIIMDAGSEGIWIYYIIIKLIQKDQWVVFHQYVYSDKNNNNLKRHAWYSCEQPSTPDFVIHNIPKVVYEIKGHKRSVLSWDFYWVRLITLDFLCEYLWICEHKSLHSFWTGDSVI